MGFYTSDLHSWISIGKKQTITRNNVKKQRRFMLGTVKNLHLKFRNENPKNKAFLPSFTKVNTSGVYANCTKIQPISKKY